MSRPVHITLLDELGRELRSLSANSIDNLTLDVADLHAGLYYVRLQDEVGYAAACVHPAVKVSTHCSLALFLTLFLNLLTLFLTALTKSAKFGVSASVVFPPLTRTVSHTVSKSVHSHCFHTTHQNKSAKGETL